MAYRSLVGEEWKLPASELPEEAGCLVDMPPVALIDYTTA